MDKITEFSLIISQKKHIFYIFLNFLGGHISNDLDNVN